MTRKHRASCVAHHGGKTFKVCKLSKMCKACGFLKKGFINGWGPKLGLVKTLGENGLWSPFYTHAIGRGGATGTVSSTVICKCTNNIVSLLAQEFHPNSLRKNASI